MQRRGLFRVGKNIKSEYSFDLDQNSSFLIRRESDNVEQVFSYSEVIDGTYDSFISGTNGAVNEWKYLGKTFYNNTDTTSQPRLLSNSGSPYIYDYNEGGYLKLTKTLDLRNDWIITLISEKEENGTSQRVNLSVRDNYGKSFVLQFQIYGTSFFYVDQPAGSFSDGYSFSDDNSQAFKLWTFERKAGVLKVYKNNTLISHTANTYNCSDFNTADTVLLGHRGDGLGKINKYKHLSLLTGANATNTDTSTYNQAIMTKYGI
jgi:hypothetical protein